MTYPQIILSDLSSGEWVCGAVWQNRYMPTYSQRISELNGREPGRIESEVCPHTHHRSGVHRYRDTRAPRMAWA